LFEKNSNAETLIIIFESMKNFELWRTAVDRMKLLSNDVYD
jgi:hypothetical protein